MCCHGGLVLITESQELAEWIARYVDPSGRFTREPLLVNPRTGERWGHWSLRDAWLRSAHAIGLGSVKFYEATKAHHGDRCDCSWRE